MGSKTVLIFIGVVVIGIGLIVVAKNYSNTKNLLPQTGTPEVSNIAKWEPKSDDQANAAVEVTPLDISSQSAEWKFNILMNTHMVELDQDLTSASVLVDDQGKQYKPLKWDGAPAGGHHRSGVLVFKAIAPAPKSIEVKMTGIGGVERNFTWQL